MKISGVGPPGIPTEGVAPPEEIQRPAESFAEKLQGGSSPSPAQAPPPVGPLADIAADLQAGKISAQVALDRVVERVVTAQVGPTAPAAVRAEVTAAVRRALEEDPLLAQKLRALGA
jgi:hypothetical protein